MPCGPHMDSNPEVGNHSLATTKITLNIFLNPKRKVLTTRLKQKLLHVVLYLYPQWPFVSVVKKTTNLLSTVCSAQIKALSFLTDNTNMVVKMELVKLTHQTRETVIQKFLRRDSLREMTTLSPLCNHWLCANTSSHLLQENKWSASPFFFSFFFNLCVPPSTSECLTDDQKCAVNNWDYDSSHHKVVPLF